MATVRLSFTPAPAHVRTARLVGVAVARRAGVADADIDEVRLAIGEACSRAVALHRRHHLSDLVEVELNDEDRFTVRVTDRAPVDPAELPAAGDDPEHTDPFGLLGSSGAGPSPMLDPGADEDVAVGVALTVLAGLVDDLSVEPAIDGVGTRVRMSWPTGQLR
jgi:anti-sigma regulatory factor (Ser/Thr protein kinase)